MSDYSERGVVSEFEGRRVEHVLVTVIGDLTMVEREAFWTVAPSAGKKVITVGGAM